MRGVRRFKNLKVILFSVSVEEGNYFLNVTIFEIFSMRRLCIFMGREGANWQISF